MLIVNNKALKITNKWLNPVAGSGPTPPGPTPTYYHVYTSATNGTITAAPVSGISGTTVTLSNTPNAGYVFDSYSLTGATLYDTNKFDINNSDVNVVGIFNSYNPLNLPANTVRVRTNDGNAPVKGSNTSYETATLVQGTSDVYDVYKSGTNFDSLLYGSTNVIEVLGANTTGINNMYAMFRNCKALTTIALFDTRSVTTMYNMFYSCDALTTVPLFDTANVSMMHNMFYSCDALTTVPLFNTANVTDMGCMFWACKALTTVPLFNTSKVIAMNEMFKGCKLLTSIPLFDTANVITFADMCSNCTSLQIIPLFNTSKVERMSYMFSSCYKVESGALALYQQASNQTTPPTYHSETFYNCGRDTTSGAAELAQIPSDWKS